MLLDIIKVVGQILCQVIAFTPSGFEARLSVELAGDVQEKRLVIGIVNTGVSLGALKEITAGLPLPVKVSSFDSEGTRFEIQISIDPEEAASENIPTAKSEKEGGNVPVLYQKLRQRMHAYATSVKNMEEAIAREQSQREQVFLKKVNAIILANLGREDFDVRALARSLALSRTQLYRRLQPLIHLPPSRYIRFIRLQKAKEFLEKGEMDVGEACFRVGYTFFSHSECSTPISPVRYCYRAGPLPLSPSHSPQIAHATSRQISRTNGLPPSLFSGYLTEKDQYRGQGREK